MASRRGIRRKLKHRGVNRDPLTWTGSRYDPDLDLTEINKRIRRFLKHNYSECRFAVRQEGYREIRVLVKRVNYRPINPDYLRWDVSDDDGSPPPPFVADYMNMVNSIDAYVESYDHWYKYGEYESANHFFFFRGIEFDTSQPDNQLSQQRLEMAREMGLPTDEYETDRAGYLEFLRITEKHRERKQPN